MPGLLALGAAGSALAAPPEDDFEFEGGSEDTGEDGDDDFDFEDGDTDGDEFDFDDGDDGGTDGEGGDGVVVSPADGDDGDDETGDPEDGETDPDDWGDLEAEMDAEMELSPDDEFTFEDISEDREALDRELKAGELQATGKVGTITGTIASASGEPLPGVYVRVEDADYVARTGVDGAFSLDLPPGTHQLNVELDLYKPKTIPAVTVVEGETSAALTIELVPMAGVMEEFKVEDDLNMTVEGAGQDRRKEATSESDGLDEAEMGKAGGGKASSLAVRIVGATVVEGRYLFIRGLGHRYGNTLLDGARVPSPEPEIRTVPLDVIPSGALSAINVQKSFTPDVPGDFVGGSVQFVTRDAPEEPMLSVKVGAEFNTATTARPMITSAGFTGYDLFALGNIPRALPSSFPADRPVGRLQGWSDEEVEAQGKALDTRSKVTRGDLAPANFSLGVSGGNKWALNDRGAAFGVLFAGGYKNEHQTNAEIIRQFSLSNDEDNPTVDLNNPQVDLDATKTTYTTNYNGLVKFELRANPDHRFYLTGFYSREAQDETRDMYGRARNVADLDTINYTRQRYVMRSVGSVQLTGKHKFPNALEGVELDYFGNFSRARRDDPAIREMVFIEQAGGDYLIDRSNGPTGTQLFLDLTDNNENAAANLTLPFKGVKGLETKFELGAWFDAKQRGFAARRFDYNYVTDLEVPPGRDNPINHDTIGFGQLGANGGTRPFFLSDRSRPQDNYAAWSRNVSAYAMLELPFASWFEVAGGVRVESNVIDVRSVDPFEQTSADELDSARLNDLDILPALSLIFSPKLPEGAGDFNIRLSGSRTVARPEFRELAPFQFRDYVGGFTKSGYPELQSTRVWNAGLRFEWFPGTAQVIALSGFFKHFSDPIEEVIAASANPIASFANVPSAINGGAELELRKDLGFLVDKDNARGRDVAEDFSLGVNFAYIYSRVTLGAPCYSPELGPPRNDNGEFVEQEGCRDDYQVSTSRTRPLQGQSPWIVNAFVDYDNRETGTNVRVMYNAFGPYIAQVSGLGLPDVYQQPMHQIDVTASQRLLSFRRNDWGDLRHQLLLTLDVNNMINTAKRTTQGGELTYATRDGVGIALGLQWKY